MYSYSYDYGMEEELTEFFGEYGFAILGAVLGVLLVVLAVSIVFYVLQAAGLYTIAKRRGIHNPWLAWIPVANYWIVGSISDQYQYVVKGRVKNKRKILLILYAVSIGVNMIVNFISGFMTAMMADTEAGLVVSSVSGILVGLVSFGCSITVLVLWHMALYDLYSSCSPDNNVLFLVLGIIFGFTIPFFIFCNRKKDGGMPPRRPEPQSYIPQPPQPDQEPWQQPRETQEPWNGPEQL